MSTFGQNLIKARKSKKISQRELSSKCGVSLGTISSLERERTTATEAVIKKLCKGLDCTPEYLLGLSEYNRKYSFSKKQLVDFINDILDWGEDKYQVGMSYEEFEKYRDKLIQDEYEKVNKNVRKN